METDPPSTSDPVGTREARQAVIDHPQTSGVPRPEDRAGGSKSTQKQCVGGHLDTEVMETGSGCLDITMESIKALQEVTDLLNPAAMPARGAEVVPGAAPGSAPTRETLYQAASRVTRVHNMLEALSLQIANQYRDLVTSHLAAPDPEGRKAPLTGKNLINESRRVTGQDLSPAWHLSPATARTRVGLARTTQDLLPECLDQVRAGEATEEHLTAVMRASIVLEPADQARLDTDLAPRLGSMTVRRTKAEAFKRACELDAATMTERAARAEKDAHVSVRPAADCMTRLSALLPLKDGVAIDVALTRHAQKAKTTGDPRSLGQIKAAL